MLENNSLITKEMLPTRHGEIPGINRSNGDRAPHYIWCHDSDPNIFFYTTDTMLDHSQNNRASIYEIRNDTMLFFKHFDLQEFSHTRRDTNQMQEDIERLRRIRSDWEADKALLGEE